MIIINKKIEKTEKNTKSYLDKGIFFFRINLKKDKTKIDAEAKKKKTNEYPISG